MNNIFFKISKIKYQQYFFMNQQHFHPYYELYYLISGKRKFFLSDTLYQLEKGNLILVKKGELHRTTYISDETHERIAINFSENILDPLFEEYTKEKVLNCFNIPLTNIPLHLRTVFEELMNKILTEYNSSDVFSNYLCINYFRELMIQLIRYQNTLQNYNMITTIPTDTSNDLIYKSVKYIRKNYSQNITLCQMSQLCNMSTTYFSKKFKQATSFGFKEYLIKVRLAEASKLLLETDYSITEIAISCGFSDSNYFGDIFKKNNNISPLQYRKNKGLI